GVASFQDVQRLPRNIVEHTPSQQDETRELKDFLYQNLYRHEHVLAMQAEAERTVATLFEAYTARPARLPEEVRLRVDGVGLPRAVCDYIAGMTDRFATQERQRLAE
ncbi:MAG: deoxyguanosinetriphosphate triphosphohydrolase, partial [Anaerolineales bacterium]